MTREFECLKTLHDIFGIPIFVSSAGKCTFRLPEENFPQETDPDFARQLYAEALSHRGPILYLETDRIYYGLCCIGKTCYCFGPLSRFTLTRTEIREYRESHRCGGELTLQRFGLRTAERILSLFHLFLTGTALPYDEVEIVYIPFQDGRLNWSSEEDAEYYRIAQSEYARTHAGGIKFEDRILDNIRNGNADAVADALYGNPPDVSDFLEVSSQSVRQIEYMLISSITLVTRAAVDGGMNTEEAYVLGDVYLRKIEQCKGNIQLLEALGIQAEIEFARRVAQAKKQKSENLYVEKCKDYISENLRRDMKVADIAGELGISRTYLSRQFSETEGMTVQQYIMKERCDHAANLLKYSDYPIAVIAEYFCFSSQSHFGSCFKKLYGMTPNEYRRLNAR